MLTRYHLSYRALRCDRKGYGENLLSAVHGRVRSCGRGDSGDHRWCILWHRFTAYGVHDSTGVHSTAAKRSVRGQTVRVPSPRFGDQLAAKRSHQVQTKHATALRFHHRLNHHHLHHSFRRRICYHRLSQCS